MRIVRNIVIAIVLLWVAAASLQYLTGETEWRLLLLAPLSLLPNMAWRTMLSRMLTLLFGAAFVLLPVIFRRRLRLYWLVWSRRLKASTRSVWDRFKLAWNVSPLWVRVFIGAMLAMMLMAGAVLSGLTLLVMSFFPVVAKTTLGFAAIQFLARTAAAQGVSQLAAFFWNLLPKAVREFAALRYRELWFWTMRRIIRNRRRVERRWRTRRWFKFRPNS